MMASMTEITCKCGCGCKKMVRTADVKRGWGLFYSKRCKAKWQEKKTGQCGAYHRRRDESYRSVYEEDHRSVEDEFHPFDSYSLGQD